MFGKVKSSVITQKPLLIAADKERQHGMLALMRLDFTTEFAVSQNLTAAAMAAELFQRHADMTEIAERRKLNDSNKYDFLLRSLIPSELLTMAIGRANREAEVGDFAAKFNIIIETFRAHNNRTDIKQQMWWSLQRFGFNEHPSLFGQRVVRVGMSCDKQFQHIKKVIDCVMNLWRGDPMLVKRIELFRNAAILHLQSADV